MTDAQSADIAHARQTEDCCRIVADELLKIVDDTDTRAAALRAIARTLAEGRLRGVILRDGEAGTRILGNTQLPPR